MRPCLSNIGLKGQMSARVRLLILCLCLASAICIVFISLPPAFALGQEEEGDALIEITNTDIATLCSAPSEIDGTVVKFSGEAVGEPVRAMEDGYVWINLADDEQTIGVYMTEEQAQAIDIFGSFDAVGDQVDVTGTYWVSSDQGLDGGVLCVHASDVSVSEEGQPIGHGNGPVRLWMIAGILLVAGLALALLRRWQKSR